MIRRSRRRQAACTGVDASPFTPESLVIGPRHLEVGTGWVASFAVIGYPREVAPGWLAPLLAYPGRLDVALHVRADRPEYRRGPAAITAGETGKRSPPHRRTRPPPRPSRGGGDRRRLRPVHPDRPRRRETVPARPLPHRARRHRNPTRRRRRRRPLAGRESAARRPAHYLAGSAGLDHHPPARNGPGPDAAHPRHRSPRRRVPVHQPRPPGRGPGHRRRTGRRPVRLQPGLVGVGALGPVRPGHAQPQQRHPGPLRRREVLPGQTRTPALPAPRRARRGHRPRRRIHAASPPQSAAASYTWAGTGCGSTRSTCPCTPTPTGAAPRRGTR